VRLYRYNAKLLTCYFFIQNVTNVIVFCINVYDESVSMGLAGDKKTLWTQSWPNENVFEQKEFASTHHNAKCIPIAFH